MSLLLLSLVFKILALVWKMRQSQKAYFNDRKREDLFQAKQLEGDVDKVLKQWLVFENGEPAGIRTMPLEDEPAQDKLF